MYWRLEVTSNNTVFGNEKIYRDWDRYSEIHPCFHYRFERSNHLTIKPLKMSTSVCGIQLLHHFFCFSITLTGLRIFSLKFDHFTLYPWTNLLGKGVGIPKLPFSHRYMVLLRLLFSLVWELGIGIVFEKLQKQFMKRDIPYEDIRKQKHWKD